VSSICQYTTYVSCFTDSITNYYVNSFCIKAAKLKQVLCRDNIGIIPSYTEQKSELAEYSKKFDHNPKIQATMTLRVLRKS